MKNKMIGIYKITSPSGRVYIGQSIDISKRIKTYKKSNPISQVRLNRSIEKYGIVNHVFEIIEECSVLLLNERERYWQDYYCAAGINGLNCILTSTSSKKMMHSESSKVKISLSNKGRLSGSRNPMFGKTHTDSAKKKISIAHKGRILTKEHKDKVVRNIAGQNKGIPMSEEMKRHLSKIKTGISMNQETKIKIRETLSKKLVVDISTGVFFSSSNEAADCYNINKSTLYYFLSGKRKNKTNLIYV